MIKTIIRQWNRTHWHSYISCQPTNCTFNSHNDCTIARYLISHILRPLASILKKNNYHKGINLMWASRQPCWCDVGLRSRLLLDQWITLKDRNVENRVICHILLSSSVIRGLQFFWIEDDHTYTHIHIHTYTHTRTHTHTHIHTHTHAHTYTHTHTHAHTHTDIHTYTHAHTHTHKHTHTR